MILQVETTYYDLFKNTRTHSQTCVKLRESVIIDISCLDFRLHSPLGFIPEHHAALKKKKKERLTHTHSFSSDPLSGWTGGWWGKQEAEVRRKKNKKNPKKKQWMRSRRN